MKIGDVATTWNVPFAEIPRRVDLPAGTAPAAALRDLESELFSVTNLRDWLGARASGTPAPGASTSP